jgi:hypothetical protein
MLHKMNEIVVLQNDAKLDQFEWFSSKSYLINFLSP